jgi:hypothetical protein
MIPRILAWLGAILLLLFLWAFSIWLMWTPAKIVYIPTIPGSWCADGKCWVFEGGKRVRL